MANSLAGKLAPESALIDISQLVRAFYDEHPDPARPAEGVSFGTSGHRGSALRRTFNEDHIVAIAHAICDYRAANGTDGPLYLGKDTHALSEPASRVACECLAARGVDVRIAEGDSFTPTPVVSTPSSPPTAGARSTSPTGSSSRRRTIRPRMAASSTTRRTAARPTAPSPPGSSRAPTSAFEKDWRTLPRIPYERALREGLVKMHDFVTPYVDDLGSVIDLGLVARSGVRLGADPMGGASVHYWGRIAERYGLNLEVVRTGVDPTFGFIPLDHDGKIRTDCSSPYAMANLLSIRERFDLSFGNDADADRHGIVSRSGGLVPPNHFLSVCADYLFGIRGWPAGASLGKTVVSSSVLDRVAHARGRAVVEVPVGFKWFVTGLADGSLGFAGEESAGASLLRRDGTLWTTDKDGLVLNLLGAEILAKTSATPPRTTPTSRPSWNSSSYTRLDEPAPRSSARRSRPSLRPTYARQRSPATPSSRVSRTRPATALPSGA